MDKVDIVTSFQKLQLLKTGETKKYWHWPRHHEGQCAYDLVEKIRLIPKGGKMAKE